MIGNLIQQQFFEGHNQPLGSALTVVLMLALLVFMVFYLRATQRANRET
jgi:spermidine/putrescine transport system permease protein